MVRRSYTQLIDDLNGKSAQKSVRFGIDGVEYEIDLSEENAIALRRALSQYMAVARKAPRAVRDKTGGAPRL